MSLASLLKKGSLRGFATATPATVATDKPFIASSVATVATVNVAKAQNPAANDPAQILALVSTGKVSTLVSKETLVRNESVRSEVRTERPVSNDAVATQVASPRAFFNDPDRWAWPHSQAMNTVEIGTFTARLARFADKGIKLDAAQALADRLVTRDREADERRLCLECAHLAGHATGA